MDGYTRKLYLLLVLVIKKHTYSLLQCVGTQPSWVGKLYLIDASESSLIGTDAMNTFDFKRVKAKQMPFLDI